MRLVVVGGPADGADAASCGARLRWIRADGRGYATPGPGRALYRRCGAQWMFTGVEAWTCRACGVLVVERAPSCGLCGAERDRSIQGGM